MNIDSFAQLSGAVGLVAASAAAVRAKSAPERFGWATLAIGCALTIANVAVSSQPEFDPGLERVLFLASLFLILGGLLLGAFAHRHNQKVAARGT